MPRCERRCPARGVKHASTQCITVASSWRRDISRHLELTEFTTLASGRGPQVHAFVNRPTTSRFFFALVFPAFDFRADFWAAVSFRYGSDFASSSNLSAMCPVSFGGIFTDRCGAGVLSQGFTGTAAVLLDLWSACSFSRASNQASSSAKIRCCFADNFFPRPSLPWCCRIFAAVNFVRCRGFPMHWSRPNLAHRSETHSQKNPVDLRHRTVTVLDTPTFCLPGVARSSLTDRLWDSARRSIMARGAPTTVVHLGLFVMVGSCASATFKDMPQWMGPLPQPTLPRAGLKQLPRLQPRVTVFNITTSTGGNSSVGLYNHGPMVVWVPDMSTFLCAWYNAPLSESHGMRVIMAASPDAVRTLVAHSPTLTSRYSCTVADTCLANWSGDFIAGHMDSPRRALSVNKQPR